MYGSQPEKNIKQVYYFFVAKNKILTLEIKSYSKKVKVLMEKSSSSSRPPTSK